MYQRVFVVRKKTIKSPPVGSLSIQEMARRAQRVKRLQVRARRDRIRKFQLEHPDCDEGDTMLVVEECVA
jgi:hypothetical protein